MNKKSVITVAALLVALTMGLAGCDDSNPATNQNNGSTQAYDPAADQKFRFERMRTNTRNGLTEEAGQNPDKMGYVTMSLWDYVPITTLLDFEQKYPNLKVIWTEVMVKGMVSPTDIDPEKPLKEELDRGTKLLALYFNRELQNIKDHPDIFNASDLKAAQIDVDTLKAGDVRTFGFAVQGKFKDIEAMALQAYGEKGKLIRVINPIERISTGELPFSDYEPIYANDDKTLDRGK